MKINNLGNQPVILHDKKIKDERNDAGSLHQIDRVTFSDPDVKPETLPSSKFLSEMDKMLKHDALHDMSKIELHRHLEGSFTPEMVIKIAKKYNIELPSYDVETLRPYIQVTKDDKDLIAFLTKFNLIGKLFVSKEAIKDLTYEVIAEASKDNVKYLELRFCPLTMAGHGKPYKKTDEKADGKTEDTEHKRPQLDLRTDVMDGVLEGIEEARKDFDTNVNLIMIASRKLRADGAMKTLELAKEYRDKGINSLDLAGDEFNYPPEEFVPFFQEAEKAGFYTTGHGAEARGADSANTLKEDGHVDRLGHGLRLFEDPQVEKKAAQEHWVLEQCPTSNEQTLAVKQFDKEHYPFDKYDKEGIVVTVNTDDPGVCNVTLTSENERVMDLYDYSLEKMESLNLRALDVAFISDEKKKEMREKLLKNYEEVNKNLKRQLDIREKI